MAENPGWFGSMEPPSSPPSVQSEISTAASGSRKVKKPPPVTPRRFNRFFTPRTSTGSGSLSNLSGKSGRQLRDITRAGGNRGRAPRSNLGKRVLFEDLNGDQSGFQTPRNSPKKRRLDGVLTPESSPLQSSPIRKRSCSLDATIYEDEREEEEASSPTRISASPEPVFPQPVLRTACQRVDVRVLSRSFGGARALGRGWIRDHCSHWQHQTADWYSLPEHSFASPSLPFSSASGNNNDLVAIGDESGTVVVFNSSLGIQQSHPSMELKSHNNAVMDLTFSSDDSILATASGDQGTHIIDIRTSKPRCALSGHSASVKQVRFQPGNDNVLATSSRDGSVQLWDLRCRGTVYMMEIPDPSNTAHSLQLRVPHHHPYNSIPDAHGEVPVAQTHNTLDPGRRLAFRDETASRRGDVSITAIEFLSHGRENLLITGASSITSVRLWDIRGRYSRRSAPIPIASTALPEAHSNHRHYGISSLQLNTDDSRFYALSRDCTVYAYSTNHLVLGNAPELSSSSRPTLYQSAAKPGLGPIYGFRHPRLHVTSFFVKAALRKAAPGRPELLAVGSSDACPILFPTDEVFFDRPAAREDLRSSNDEEACAETDGEPRSSTRRAAPASSSRPSLSSSRSPQPGLRRTPSANSISTRLQDTIAIYQHGTALVRGHAREVTGLAWTRRGELVSLSDDLTARMWTEGGTKARELRIGGEVEGRRWGCGWAEVGEGWDDEDG